MAATLELKIKDKVITCQNTEFQDYHPNSDKLTKIINLMLDDCSLNHSKFYTLPFDYDYKSEYSGIEYDDMTICIKSEEHSSGDVEVDSWTGCKIGKFACFNFDIPSEDEDIAFGHILLLTYKQETIKSVLVIIIHDIE